MVLPDGTVEKMSSVALRQKIRNDEDEDRRKAAYEGIREIGPFAADNGFCDIVKGSKTSRSVAARA